MDEVTPRMAMELLYSAEGRLKQLQSQGLKLDKIQALVQKAYDAIDARKKNDAILSINELGEELDQVEKFANSYIELEQFCQKNLKEAESMNIEITEQKELLASTQEAFMRENFSEALSSAKECKQSLIDEMFLFLTEEIKGIYNQLKELPKNALEGKNFQQRFNDADAAIKDNDFSLAWIITKQLRDDSTKLIGPYLLKAQEVAKDKIIEFQNDIEDVRTKGADLEDAKEVFAELIERMKKAELISEYKEIIELTSAGKNALARALRRKERVESKSKEVKIELDNVISDFNKLKNDCAIPDSLERLVKSAEDNFASGKFDAVTEDLDACKIKLDKLRTASEPKIEVKFQSDQLKSDLWNRTKIIIANKGLANANKLNIRFSGPVEVRRMPELDKLELNKTMSFEIGIKPEGAGNVPIDVDIYFNRPWDDKAYHDHQELWLDVAPSGTPPVATQTVDVAPVRLGVVAGAKINCIFCHSEINKSDPIFKCRCGTIYHLDCIAKQDSCLQCGAEIKPQIGVTASVKDSRGKVDDIDWE